MRAAGPHNLTGSEFSVWESYPPVDSRPLRGSGCVGPLHTEDFVIHQRKRAGLAVRSVLGRLLELYSEGGVISFSMSSPV
ncbi:hypothetical protein FQA47_015470 [Oryzias melastigma]|uniref:Uncharacterized protein n=1 Tax=Oryzias melastigma TaxID=30732 RepID=A0A834L1M5_ORYME|nr:hypothetical protein FQA47_015470 [Oryzias melastigma]